MLCKTEKRDEELELEKLSKNESGKILIKYLSEIVRARYSEIFYFISSELKKIGKD
jgi:cell division ATPase FtsA